jgi:nucleoside-diphosphate-sugar epimerase
MRILITGGSGYIAKSIYQSLCEKHDVTLVTKNDLNLTRRDEVKHYFKNKYFDLVIHTAVTGGNRLFLDGPDVVLSNLLMYDNLMRCRDKFTRLIHFGSGAEDKADNPYGFSKHVIGQLMKLDSKSINVKIYAVFDENELSTRFIKSNILRYINRESMIIHQDKKMDFFYMKDLVSLVEWLISQREEEFPIKEINCSYLEKYTLVQIAEIINSLDDYKVDIIVENEGEEDDYCNTHPIMLFDLVGLEQGIKNTYNKLKNDQTN